MLASFGSSELPTTTLTALPKQATHFFITALHLPFKALFQVCASHPSPHCIQVLSWALGCLTTEKAKRSIGSMGLTTILLACSFVAIMISSPTNAQTTPAPFLPPSPAPAPAPHFVNLADLLSVAGPFHTFLNYIEQTQVIQTFQNQANNTKQGITIFVPKDSSFSSLKKTTFSNLTQDQLKTLLLYHAFPKFYSLSEFNNLSALNPVSTFAGGAYTLNLTDNSGLIHVASTWSNPKITSGVYTTPPVAIYEVDKVLLPMAIFRTNPPLAPAPAPAPDATKPSDLGPSSRNGIGSSPKSSESSTTESSACSISLSLFSYLVMAISSLLMFLL